MSAWRRRRGRWDGDRPPSTCITPTARNSLSTCSGTPWQRDRGSGPTAQPGPANQLGFLSEKLAGGRGPLHPPPSLPHWQEQTPGPLRLRAFQAEPLLPGSPADAGLLGLRGVTGPGTRRCLFMRVFISTGLEATSAAKKKQASRGLRQGSGHLMSFTHWIKVSPS